MNRWSALALLLALAGALALRVPQLETRPLHNDEAVNAVKASELWRQGRYIYDPDEYHGPTLHYATLPFLWLSGARNSEELTDATLRLAPIVFGVALILLLPLFQDGLGRHAMMWAALFTAVSPAMVFYSRYFIHEMLLVFFAALTLGAGWRYVQTRRARWAVLAGASIGLMSATKETFVLNMAAMGAAAILTIVWTWRKGSKVGSLLGIWNWQHAALAFAAAFTIWMLFFSSFFAHFTGLLDSVRTYLPWLKRAGGHSPHIHPWNFYLERLAWFHPAKGPIWSEGLILVLAVIGAIFSVVGSKSPLRRFLTLYTLILTAIYCGISYKTPWCLLSFFHGMILLAGIGAAALVEFFRAKPLKLLIIVAILSFVFLPLHRFRYFQTSWPDGLMWQAWRGSVAYAFDRRNPYVYAQTVPDLQHLVRRIEGIARISPTGYDTMVKVIAPENDYWPLPWYLRRFRQLGWYDQLPAEPFAPMVVVSSKLDARLDDKSDRKWIMAGLTEQRPGQFFELYVELDLWKKYVASLPRVRD